MIQDNHGLMRVRGKSHRLLSETVREYLYRRNRSGPVNQAVSNRPKTGRDVAVLAIY